MHSLTLPSAEETLLELKVGDETYKIDLIDLAEVWGDTLTKYGEEALGDKEALLTIFMEMVKDKFKITLSKTTALSLLSYMLVEEKELKKKLYELLEISDTTISDSPPQTETSDSLNSSDPTLKPKNSSERKKRSARKTSSESSSSQEQAPKKPRKRKTSSS